MSCVKLFAGRVDDYQFNDGFTAPAMFRDSKCDFTLVDQQCATEDVIPIAWKEAWTNIQYESCPGQSNYSQVISLYGCDIITSTSRGEERWGAAVVFICRGSRGQPKINNLILVQDKELLDELWANHDPRNYEWTLKGVRATLYRPVSEYIKRNDISVETMYVENNTLRITCGDITNAVESERLMSVVGSII